MSERIPSFPHLSCTWSVCASAYNLSDSVFWCMCNSHRSQKEATGLHLKQDQAGRLAWVNSSLAISYNLSLPSKIAIAIFLKKKRQGYYKTPKIKYFNTLPNARIFHTHKYTHYQLSVSREHVFFLFRTPPYWHSIHSTFWAQIVTLDIHDS